MKTLYPFQQDAKRDVLAAWSDGARNVLLVLPTGGGKTVLFSDLIREERGASVAIAHRQELVGQISMALAQNEVKHRIIGSPDLARECTRAHLRDAGRNFVDPQARCAVAGVDTLVRMDAKLPWFSQVKLWVCDEAHHLQKGNKWGNAVAMFPNARGLGVTATPRRADGRGLGRHADGVLDLMVEGPTTRELMQEGWLSSYRIFAPPSDVDTSHIPLSAGGDFSPPAVSAAVHASRTIVGDVVGHYLRIAAGKLGVTFAVDVASAGEIAAAYRAGGVPAEVVSAKTPGALRAEIIRRFKAREILQLVNVDLFGEGFDLPAIEVVSLARPTCSLALYLQQIGRALRTLDGKTHGIIIDHVGNVHRHGLPDSPRVWTLDRQERRSRSTVEIVTTRICVGCTGVYHKVLSACPYCGFAWTPALRTLPEHVDGDLAELSPEALARLRGEIDKPLVVPYGAAPEVVGAVRKRHRERVEAQEALRAVMALWGGAQGDDLRAAQRRFYIEFGIDVASAQALGRADAEILMGRIATWPSRTNDKVRGCGAVRLERRVGHNDNRRGER